MGRIEKPSFKHNEDSKIKEMFENAKNWCVDHSRVLMPVVLVICVIITVLIAVGANKKNTKELVEVSNEMVTEVVADAATTQIPLEENAYPEVNELINTYYNALAEGNVDTIKSINNNIDDMEAIRLQELSNYIEKYDQIDVYTKAGPVPGSFLTYVYSTIKFKDYEEHVPGMQALYICTDESGNRYINDGNVDDSVINYLRDASLQDDVVDLNNKVVAEYNDMLASDEELSVFLADMTQRIDISVGEALAAAEAEANAAAEAEASEDADEEVASVDVIKKAKATDVVNIRKSDSIESDVLGKTAVGDEFTVIEEQGNGWSKIEYDGGEAFLKTEYLETVSEVLANANIDNDDQGNTTQEAAANTNDDDDDDADAAAAASVENNTTVKADSNGKVTAKESVKVRKSASKTADALGTLYAGDKVEFVMNQADGWTKVKYKGETGFVKSEYLQ